MFPWTIIAIFCDSAVKLSEELFISECEKLTRKKTQLDPHHRIVERLITESGS